MPTFPFYQVDAFANQPFQGNQACVMPMDAFLADDVLLKIAAENNVAETAYLVPQADGVWALRWFTPALEVPLCGHATLASAHVLFDARGYDGGSFISRRRNPAGSVCAGWRTGGSRWISPRRRSSLFR